MTGWDALLPLQAGETAGSGERVRLGEMFEDLRQAARPVLKLDAEAEVLTAELPA